jgi:hypothetical protein
MGIPLLVSWNQFLEFQNKPTEKLISQRISERAI